MDFEWMFPGHTPHQILELFTDADFLEEFSKEIPVAEHRADIERLGQRTTVDLHWKFPTEMAPSVVRPFLPPQVALEWTTSWTTADEVISGAFETHSNDPAVTFHGEASLESAGKDGTAWHLSGPVSAKRRAFVPGSLIAGLLENLFRAVLKDQATVAERRLGIEPGDHPDDE